MDYKGIVLAGGTGGRMYPVTKGTVKQLLPVYDKPMIYYPLSVLMLANIREILIITTARDQALFRELLGDGTRFGVSLTYAVQEEPNGIAEAFKVGANFIANSKVCLILGDNIFYGQGFLNKLESAMEFENGASIFGYQVKDPGRFGVIEFDNERKVLSLEEKPEFPKSRFAATGLYFFDNDVVEIAKTMEPSERGELEITDINNYYLRQNKLRVQILGRGFAWLDAGTPDSLLKASQFVQTIEERQGFKLACLEEMAYRKGWVSNTELIRLGKEVDYSEYGQYLLEIARETQH
ncbi:glucose-1-phosphate thymidylyltransferase RfbA [Planctobacterium marinum]|uniref:glucose-1-phosphate thymidylyltransferase RfbA n=1 Tax=Planctobacterium marinum TaxID=1631968 RepID=UPI001E4B0A46|nr:glucose-1-phosphate thymidylyltransferase RfbA [Planctobacterium marinum]MCC2606178.1 glucose-1-phosphate thymidylyltransferase RfbA [Planctobacterium marinum]